MTQSDFCKSALGRAFLAILLLAATALPTTSIAQSDPYVFEVDTLNSGLPNRPDHMDLSTPQSAIEAFLTAVDAERFSDAAHILDMSHIPVTAQVSRGAMLAEELSVVLDRKVVISWQVLLERPDSLNAQAPSDNTMAGEPRRSVMLGLLEIDGRPVVIRLNRIKPSEDDPVWVFSSQTVDNIPALFQAYGPTRLEKALPDALRADAFWGLRWWEIIALPLTALFTYLLCTALWRGLTYAARNSDFTGKLPISAAIKGLRTPVVLAAGGFIVSLATSYVFVVSGIVSNILEPFIVLTFVASIIVLVVNVIDAMIDEFFAVDVEDLSAEDARDVRARVTTLSAVRRLVIVVAVLAGTGIVLATSNVFQTLGFSLLASAGALSLMLGLAARDVLGNILASMQISMNRTARIGDKVVFDDYLATVEDITFTYVKLKVWNGNRLIVPVKTFVEKEFENWSTEPDPQTRTVSLEILAETDISGLKDKFDELARADNRIDHDGLEAVVTDQSLFSTTLRFAMPVPRIDDGWAVECEMREALVLYLFQVEAGGMAKPDNVTLNAA